MEKELTRGQKIRRTNIARYGKDFYSKMGKKSAKTSVLTGIKNGTLKVVPVK